VVVVVDARKRDRREEREEREMQMDG